MRELNNTPMTIKAKMSKNIDKALEVLDLCLKDTTLSSDKRYKIASDYISLYLRMENEKRKEEEHREGMRAKKLNSLISEYKLSELESPETSVEDNGKFSTKVV